jgi:acyl-CoA thioesterase-1
MRRLHLFAWLFALFAVGIGNALGEELQIVALGTSFTNGKGVFRRDAWPAKLEAKLKAEGSSVHVSNEGVNGDTTLDLKRRLNRAVPEGTALVILEYAIGNDRRAGIDFEETVKNVDEIISQLVSKKIQVLLVVRAKNSEQLERRKRHFKRTTSQYGISIIGIEQPESSLLGDHQHPTAEAHTQIAESMVDPIKALIAKQGD